MTGFARLPLHEWKSAANSPFRPVAVYAHVQVRMRPHTHDSAADPRLPLLLHLHEFLFTTWFVLSFVQARLVARQLVDLHRKLAVVVAVLAPLCACVAIRVLFNAGRRSFLADLTSLTYSRGHARRFRRIRARHPERPHGRAPTVQHQAPEMSALFARGLSKRQIAARLEISFRGISRTGIQSRDHV
jgi:hypothetical protein